MIKFTEIYENILSENPDMVKRAGYKNFIEFDEINAFPFYFINDKAYVGSSGKLHSRIKQYYEKIGIRIPVGVERYSGRIWINFNMISFWEYPRSKSEMQRILMAIAQELKKLHNINLDINKLNIELTHWKFDGSVVAQKEHIEIACDQLRYFQRGSIDESKYEFFNTNVLLKGYDINKKYKVH